MMNKEGHATEGDLVREALWIMRGLQKQAEEGFSEVVMQNPGTSKQRKLTIELLKAVRSVDREDVLEKARG
jgi:hypothetical protein